MEPLTHLFTGALLADILPRPPQTTKKRWTAFAMILAASPDADMLPALLAAFPNNLMPGNRLFDSGWLAVHRGYTHAGPVLLAAGLCAGLAGWRFLGGKNGFWQWLLLAQAAFFSHCALDILNGGIQFWLPFSHEWLAWGDMPVMDPVIMLFLLLAFFANHPPCFENRHSWGSLQLLNKAGRLLHRRVGAPLGARLLSGICLALTLAVIVIRNWPFIMPVLVSR